MELLIFGFEIYLNHVYWKLCLENTFFLKVFGPNLSNQQKLKKVLWWWESAGI